MRTTSIITCLFAAGSIAMPVVNKRQIEDIVVTEIIYVDTSGATVSTLYETGAPSLRGGAPAPTPSPAAASPPAGPPPAAQSPPASPAPAPAPQPSSASVASSAPSATPSPVSQSGGSGGTSSGSSAADTVSSYIQSNGNDDTLFVGWVDPTDPKFGQIAVYHHNIHRLNHSASEVVYNQTMADLAQAWTEKCIGDEEVPPGSGLGMNVAFSSSTDNYNPSDWITGSWYNSEEGNFPYGNANPPVGDGTDFNSWGHFSQLVWPNVTQIGCGVHSGCGGDYDVHSGCFYFVEGNIEGAFNVVNEPVGAPIAYPNGLTSM